MMQMTHICITRGFRVPESQFDRTTSFQTRPNPPGDAQLENVDAAGARLSRGARLPFGTTRVSRVQSASHRPASSAQASLPPLAQISPLGPWLLGAISWSFGFSHWSFPPYRSFHLRLSRKSTHYRFSKVPSERGSPEPHPAS